jgi:hypothetical protein
MSLPAMMLESGSRSMSGHAVQVSFAGQIVVNAPTWVTKGTDPIHAG